MGNHEFIIYNKSTKFYFQYFYLFSLFSSFPYCQMVPPGRLTTYKHDLIHLFHFVLHSFYFTFWCLNLFKIFFIYLVLIIHYLNLNSATATFSPCSISLHFTYQSKYSFQTIYPLCLLSFPRCFSHFQNYQSQSLLQTLQAV